MPALAAVLLPTQHLAALHPSCFQAHRHAAEHFGARMRYGTHGCALTYIKVFRTNKTVEEVGRNNCCSRPELSKDPRYLDALSAPLRYICPWRDSIPHCSWRLCRTPYFHAATSRTRPWKYGLPARMQVYPYKAPPRLLSPTRVVTRQGRMATPHVIAAMRSRPCARRTSTPKVRQYGSMH